MNLPTVGLHPFAKRIEVKLLKRSLRLEADRGVRDQKRILAEPDVGLDAAKALVEGVEEWPFVFVVVVGVRPLERAGRLFGRLHRSE